MRYWSLGDQFSFSCLRANASANDEPGPAQRQDKSPYKNIRGTGHTLPGRVAAARWTHFPRRLNQKWAVAYLVVAVNVVENMQASSCLFLKEGGRIMSCQSCSRVNRAIFFDWNSINLVNWFRSVTEELCNTVLTLTEKNQKLCTDFYFGIKGIKVEYLPFVKRKST